MQQAQRIADKTVFMYLGEVKEEGYTSQIFGNPLNEVTANYITGQFG
jgi:phosphate transport system ATP-binding protein